MRDRRLEFNILMAIWMKKESAASEKGEEDSPLVRGFLACCPKSRGS